MRTGEGRGSVLLFMLQWTLYSCYGILVPTITLIPDWEVTGMPSNGEIIERSINNFQKVQKRMFLARKENAVETYEDLKEDYIALKVILTSLGVNLISIDKINE